jgi:hypothetical protein
MSRTGFESASSCVVDLKLCPSSIPNHMVGRFYSLVVYLLFEACCRRPQSLCTSIKLSGPGVYAGNMGEVETSPKSAALFSHSGWGRMCSLHLRLMLLSRDNQSTRSLRYPLTWYLLLIISIQSTIWNSCFILSIYFSPIHPSCI